MKEKHAKQNPSWIAAVKARGLSGVMLTVLDVLEPLAPFASQLLYVVQPISGALGASAAVRDLAEALDSPEGLADLRREFERQDDA